MSTPAYLWQLPTRILSIGRRPLLMGIVNVTPDSFSDGGQWLDPAAAVDHGLKLLADGADILDIGGESTRPGAAPVPTDEELRRVVPVIEALSRQTSVPLSVDTSKAKVARQAMVHGASIINDVTGLAGDPAMVEVALTTGAGVVIMHMQGTPQTMQSNPVYGEVVRDVRAWLEQRLAALTTAGIGIDRIVIDPGIGFGKRLEHNLELLARLDEFLKLGRPLCLGVSRKGFINRVLGQPGVAEQGSAGTIGTLLYGVTRGAVQIARVHDVAAVNAALTLFLTLEQRAGRREHEA